MKQIFVGPYNRSRLYLEIRKTCRMPKIILTATLILLIAIPYFLSDNIFNNANGTYSNVVLVQTNSGTGSAVLLRNNYLLTAAHVIDGMQLNDKCDIEFLDPNSTDMLTVYAQAELVAKGDWEKSNDNSVFSQDYALLQISTIDASHVATPAQLGISNNVKISDKASVEGFPGGVYSKTDGSINNITGGVTKNDDLFIVSARAWPGNSGGALFNANNQLIGIVTNVGVGVVNNDQTISLKIDKIKQDLQNKGFQIN